MGRLSSDRDAATDKPRRSVQRGIGLFVALFAGIWLGYYLLVFTVAGGSGTLAPAIGHQVLFATLLVGAIIATAFVAARSRPADRRRPPPGRLLQALVIGLLLSAVGIGCLLVDRIAYQEIDFSDGICGARYQMARSADVRGPGISSPFSVVGNLLATSFFATVGVLLSGSFSRRTFYWTSSASVACLVAVSVFYAGRTTIMLFVAFCAAFLCVRIARGLPLPRPRLVDGGALLAIAAVLVFFLLSMFDCRARSSGVTATEYLRSFTPFLGVEAGDGQSPAANEPPAVDEARVADKPPVASDPASGKTPSESRKPGRRPPADAAGAAGEVETAAEIPDVSALTPATGDGSKAAALVRTAVLYAVHSVYTFSAILSRQPGPEEGRITLVYGETLLERVGLAGEPRQEWFRSGRFASLPGALYHDAGVAGMLGGALLLGLAAAGSLIAVARFRGSVVTIGVGGAILVILLLSPLHPATEFRAFPFICFSFVLVAALGRALSSLRPAVRERPESSMAGGAGGGDEEETA